MCPVCGNNQFNFAVKQYKTCLRCGTVSVVSVPRAHEMDKVREEKSEGVISEQRQALINRDYADRLGRFKKYIKKNSRLLDFGCGAGLFVRFLISQEYKGYGFDKSRAVSNYLDTLRLPIFRSVQKIPHNYFDVVTSFDVIEHTLDPHKFIQEIKSKLTRHGVIMITTPNAYGLSGRLLKHRWWVFGPAFHYVLFSPKSLKDLLEKEGFEVLKVRTDIFTPWFTPMNALWCKILNKIVYLFVHPFEKYILHLNLGDNIEILAKKK